MTIQILPENLCNKIAAGEVVERPASVVKELLENSLDAGATEVSIDVEKGGKRLIRITDNGCGMGRDDLFLCLERHATSKISSEEDLFALHTLGFRGEALPSIASVSRLNLRSRDADSLEGLEIYIEGGTVRRTDEIGMPRGTMIEVRNLFFNTPARRKFLRRDETELGHISDVVTKQALAFPQVQFRLRHNGRSLFEVPRNASLAERIGALLGRPLLRELLPLEREGGEGIKLSGYVGQPAANRSSTSSIYTFINGRYIRDRVVQHAIMEGYRSLLMKGRYPVAVLFLNLDPAEVDVNVHPTKHEVRFRNQAAVHDFIAAAIREALRPSEWLGEGRARREDAPPAPDAPLSLRSDAATSSPVSPPSPQEQRSEHYRERVGEALQGYARQGPREADAPPFTLPDKKSEERGFFTSLRVLGQYRNSYLVCQHGDDLILVDQHAGHERVRFEELRRQYRAGEVARQSLLFPEVMEFDFKTAALLGEHLAEIEDFGFEVEPFGGNAFALKAVPQVLAAADAKRLIHDVIADIEAVGRSSQAQDAVDATLMSLACHSVVRANQPLGPGQIEALLQSLDAVDFKAHCPHGRPVMIRLGLEEVERLFKRG